LLRDIGDYRLIVEILDEELVIVAVSAAYRNAVYGRK
jgi:mRNA-degrading endonuclease RelE of RelBE toxin-antitoxin system